MRIDLDELLENIPSTGDVNAPIPKGVVVTACDACGRVFEPGDPRGKDTDFRGNTLQHELRFCGDECRSEYFCHIMRAVATDKTIADEFAAHLLITLRKSK